MQTFYVKFHIIHVHDVSTLCVTRCDVNAQELPEQQNYDTLSFSKCYPLSITAHDVEAVYVYVICTTMNYVLVCQQVTHTMLVYGTARRGGHRMCFERCK